MKALICGSRDFNNYTVLKNRLDYLPITEIVSGGARGADTLAERYADNCRRGLPITSTIIHADWDKHGKSAGYIRNAEMFKENPDIVIAFWDGISNGTRDTLKKANKLKIDTLIVYF